MKIQKNMVGRKVRMVDDGREATIIDQGGEGITLRFESGLVADIYFGNYTSVGAEFLEYLENNPEKAPLHIHNGEYVELVSKSYNYDGALGQLRVTGIIDDIYVSFDNNTPIYFARFNDGSEYIFNIWESLKVIEEPDDNEPTEYTQDFASSLSIIQALCKDNDVYILTKGNYFEIWSDGSEDDYVADTVEDVIECVKALNILNKFRQ